MSQKGDEDGWVANWRPIEIFPYDWWPRSPSLNEKLARSRLQLAEPIGAHANSALGRSRMPFGRGRGACISNTQLFNYTLEDSFFLVQRLPPLVSVCLHYLLSQIGQVDFQRTARNIAFWLAEVE
jgi:hypothetical protein